MMLRSPSAAGRNTADTPRMDVRAWRGAVLWAALALATATACACPIPVYQYALENWAPDPYRVVVTHAESLTDKQTAALTILQAAAQGATNLDLVLRDGADTGAADAQQAVIRVYYPHPTRMQEPVWEGDLTPEHARRLVHSPVRERLGRALAERVSAVWILLEGGDRQQDQAAERLLTQELSRLERTLTVPESAEWGGETVTIDHRVNFSILRMSRDDPAEALLLRMLLESEPDLSTGFAGLPMVFPVYGRGRALYALVGRGIQPGTIEEAAMFLTGPCSCQIKAANPGTDLLLPTDWDAAVRPLAPATGGGPVGTGGFLQRMHAAEEQLGD